MQQYYCLKCLLRCLGLWLILGQNCGYRTLYGQESGVHLTATSTVSRKTLQTNRWPFELCEGQFQVHSMVSTAKLEPYLAKLNTLPSELKQSLAISVVEQPIHLVVLESRDSLDAYVKRLLPNAPSRRALYIRHRGPGLVLTYFNPAWLTDARHECTHALLDASGVKISQWLDEGLAEYFETANDNPLEHVTHRVSIQSQIRFGQVADLEKLERMDSSSVMTAKDYRDAWSVIAFLLNSSAQSRNSLQVYLSDLQSERAAGFLSHRLQPGIHTWRDDFTKFFTR